MGGHGWPTSVSKDTDSMYFYTQICVFCVFRNEPFIPVLPLAMVAMVILPQLFAHIAMILERKSQNRIGGRNPYGARRHVGVGTVP